MARCEAAADETERWRVRLLIGFGPTAETAMAALLDHFELLGVVRGALEPNDPVAALAAAHGVALHQARSRREVEDLVLSLRPDATVISSYNRLLGPAVLEACPVFNVHYAPLPRYRGNAPVNWALLNDENETAITVHRVTTGLDDGPILYQETVPIGTEDNATTLFERLNAIQRRELGPAVQRGLSGWPGIPQDHAKATYGCPRNPEDGEIDWRRPAAEIDQLTRALTPPFPGAFTHHQGTTLVVHRAGEAASRAALRRVDPRARDRRLVDGGLDRRAHRRRRAAGPRDEPRRRGATAGGAIREFASRPPRAARQRSSATHCGSREAPCPARDPPCRSLEEFRKPWLTTFWPAAACWSPAAPASSARTSSTSWWPRAVPASSVVDDLVRGCAANLAAALDSGRVELIVGDVRDRNLMDGLVANADYVFHQAALRITHCAAEPRLAMEVMVDATFDLVELCVRHRRPQADRGLVGLDLRAGGHVSDARGPPSLRQPHPLRCGQVVQRGTAARLPRHAWPRLRGAALFQRLRPTHGPARQVHRGAGPVDGAPRRRRAATDLRQWPPDHGLRPCARCRPRQPAGGRLFGLRLRPQRRHWARDQPDRARARTRGRVRARGSRPGVPARAGRQSGEPAAGRRAGRP